jgi:hypothetical protein
MTVRMKALKSFVYAGKRLKTGDEFDARGKLGRPGSDATVLAAICNAVAAGTAERTPVTYSTRMMSAAPLVPVATVAPQAQYIIKVDGADVALDDMEADALHAMARSLGVKVHPLSGAKKARQALLDAQKV